MSISSRHFLAAIVVLTATACDDESTDPAGTILVSASPTSLALAPGGTGSVTVTLVRGGGFDDAVDADVSGLPSGVTATVTPAQLTGNILQATVTVTVGSAVAAGTYTATITASADPLGSATTTFALTVTSQDFTLSANPPTVSVIQGGSATTTINIARPVFAGEVALSLQNPPAGITGTFNPAATTGNASQLTLNVATTVPMGNQVVTVQGTGGGVTKTTTVAVAVNAGLSLTVNPVTVSIAQGASGESTLTVTRSGFSGNITPSVSGNPAGMTVTFGPNPITGNTSTVTVNVGSTVAAGDYTLTITGDTGGIAGSPTTTLVITVTQAAGG